MPQHVPAHTQRITAPPFEPVTLAELKQHSVVEFDEDDEYLVNLLRTATAQTERDAGIALVKQTWEAVYECFPDRINLPMPPLLSVTSVEYYDTAGGQQTLATSEYQVVKHGIVGRIAPAPSKSWPAVESGRLDAVKVTFEAGYVDVDIDGNPASDAPFPLKQAIMVLAGHLYEHREIAIIGASVAELPASYGSLIDTYARVAV